MFNHAEPCLTIFNPRTWMMIRKLQPEFGDPFPSQRRTSKSMRRRPHGRKLEETVTEERG